MRRRPRVNSGERRSALRRSLERYSSREAGDDPAYAHRLPRLFALCAAAARAPPPPPRRAQPYRANDYGGFCDVPPPGTNGRSDVIELAAFLSTSAARRPTTTIAGRSGKILLGEGMVTELAWEAPQPPPSPSPSGVALGYPGKGHNRRLFRGRDAVERAIRLLNAAWSPCRPRLRRSPHARSRDGLARRTADRSLDQGRTRARTENLIFLYVTWR